MSFYGQKVTVRETRETAPSAVKIKKLENNTFEITMPDGTRIIRLHQTDIITFPPNGNFILNSGGYLTVTTKDRWNKYLPAPYRVYSGNGIWYLSRGHWGDADRTEAVYHDGISAFNFDHDVSASAGKESEHTKLKARIKKFVDSTLGKGKPWPQPGTGDCWLCMMREVKGDKTMGELHGGDAEREHILGHVKEGYMHGSLIVNALRWNHCTDFFIAVLFRSQDSGRSSFHAIARQRIRRYLQFKLGLPY